MLFTSYEFIGFAAILLLLYYLIPKKAQWCLLLSASYIFYFIAGPQFLPYILVTTLTVYSSALIMQRISDKQSAYLKEHKTAFIMQIGGALRSGKPHDNRAPDYDDWQLNGDIFFWNETLGSALEISSMGIRVDPETLDRQLSIAGCDDRRQLPFHKMLLDGELPLTIGGGIGQSRLCMLMMGCAHIGEVQSSMWDSETARICEENGIPLL